MSIPVLVEVYDEMRRLAIAGSAVAAGDFRLKKLVPPLQKSGEKAPVFAKVAQAVQAVVDSNEKTASAALLELTTLVNAILYTQGETGVAGELKPLETTDLGGQPTQASARVLKPLLEALNSTGSGRMELVRDAFERGTFKDLRLVKPALNALDDPYPEIGEFIAEKVLPLYGKAILPELRAKLDIKARGGGHVNRLQLLHRLDPEGSREIVQQALNDGSKEMKVAAIECLGSSDNDVTYLLEQARAKAKDVRAAALRALAAAGTTARDVVATLKKAIGGVDLELIITRLRGSSLPEIHDFVVDEAEQWLATLLKAKDKKEQGAAVARLQLLVSALERRKDAKAEAFLLKCFDSAAAIGAIKSEPSGVDLNEWVAQAMARGTPSMQKRLVASHATLTGGMLQPALYAARATMTPDAFYKEFSPLLRATPEKRSKKNSVEQERAAALLEVLAATEDRGRGGYRPWMRYDADYEEADRTDAPTPLPVLDPRWLDAAVEAGAVELVCDLARPGHAAANKFLAEKLAALAKKPHEGMDVLRTMTRVQHPGAADALVEALKREAKDGGYYISYWYGPMIADLPKSALPTIEALLPTLPEKMVDRLMDSVLALKNKPDEA